ncbi:MAG: tetratricopeptide repeat protein [Candidatus Theseobacter exili]|nr:tetratricopeptide repeat protein [Candidatus Theseobacter exili]
MVKKKSPSVQVTKSNTTAKGANQDVFVQQNVKMFILYKQHKRKVNIFISILVFCLVCFAAYSSFSTYENNKAVEILAFASNLAAFDKVYSEYSGTKEAPLALYQMINLEYIDSDYKKASEDCITFLKSFSQHYMAPYVKNILGYCYESQGESEKAAILFKEISEQKEPLDLIPRALTNYGRCLDEIGKQQEAEKAYEKLIQNYPDTFWAEQAEGLLVSMQTNSEKNK